MIYTAIVLLVLSYLFFTKKWYRWIYIIYKTLPRDLRAVSRFTRLNILLKSWDRNQMTVVKQFNKLAKKYPNKIAYYFEDDEWTYHQISDFSDKIAIYFKKAGLKHGDTVALLLENRPEYVCIWLGLAKIGVITALINTNLTNDPLAHSIKVAASKALIYGTNHSKAITETLPKITPIKLYQFHEDVLSDAPVLPDAVDLRSALLSIVPAPIKDNYNVGHPKDKVFYIYTSGTTGLPKAAVITNTRFFFMVAGLHFMTNIRIDDIVYDPLPLYHSAGGMVGAGQAVVFGVSVVIRKKFSASNFWPDCIKYNCTVAQYIGELCRYLLAVPIKDTDSKHKIRVMVGNGLKSQIWNQFVDRFKIKELYEFYGATEGNSNLVNIDSKVGAVGFVPRYAGNIYPVTLVRCDEQTGEPIRNKFGRCIRCQPEEPGIFIGKINPKKAINEFSGYADKEATSKKIIENVFKNGDMYFNSGDILVQDEFGYYYFKDRTGDTFRWKGENVATTEIEAVISNVVNLSDAVVYGVQIPNTDGRAGMAAIVDANKNLDMSKLCKGLKASLPAYAVPLFVRVLQSMPLTSTFKLKKVDLQTEGFNVEKITDDVYLYDAKSVSYIPLTKDIYRDVMSGKIRL